VRTLVLGMGNPYVMDDSIGLRLAGELKLRLDHTPGLSWATDCSSGGLELLDQLAGHERLVVFDAIRTRGGRPGDWYRFNAGALRETRHLSSIHDANFATALELGRALGMRLPPDDEIHIFAVEIAANDCFGEELSPELGSVYSAIRDEILAEAAPLLMTGRGPHDEL
jgi:hydrogenase maturation protease